MAHIQTTDMLVLANAGKERRGIEAVPERHDRCGFTLSPGFAAAVMFGW
jgi:hypothetical protein